MRVCASPLVIAEKTKEGLCLLHTGRGECYLLNAVASHVWNYLASHEKDTEGEGVSPEMLAQHVASHYGVEYDAALTDVRSFLADGQERGIITCLAES